MLPIEITRNIPIAHAPKNSLGASDDAQAVDQFLISYSTRSEHTRARYFIEVERFCRWLWHVKRIPLSAVTRIYMIEYGQALLRTGPTWMPDSPRRVIKAISPASVDQAFVVLTRLFRVLNQAGYLEFNPLGLPVYWATKTVKREPRLDDQKWFKPGLWFRLLRHVDRLIASATESGNQERVRYYIRWRYALRVMYELGLRVSELCGHDTSQIFFDGRRHYIRIVGKGVKERTLPITDRLLRWTNEFRNQFGLPEDFRDHPNAFMPTIQSGVGEAKSVTRKTAHRQFKELLAGSGIGVDDRTLHSIRHTRLSHLNKLLTPLEHQRFAGHGDYNTTKVYYHQLDSDMHDALNKRNRKRE